VASALLGCGDAPNNAGRLTVAIESDMALPQQIDTIHVQVQTDAVVLQDREYVVGANETSLMPILLSVPASGDPASVVTVRAWGSKAKTLRMLREVTTTIPTTRSALLRVPLQWLCDQTAHTVVEMDDSGLRRTRVASTCAQGESCVDGQCASSWVDAASLPDYTPEAVFGGGLDAHRGSCFDTVACMATGRGAVPDAECTIAKPAGPNLNVALRVTDDGICDSTGATCFVTLDAALDSAREGWRLTPARDRIALPGAVCKKLREGAIDAVYVGGDCPTKTASFPTCGDWSSVPRAAAPTDAPSAKPDAPLPTAVATVSSDVGAGPPCCPLLADGSTLYTCLCSSGGKTSTLFAIEPSRAEQHVPAAVLSVTPPADRQSAEFAAAVFDGGLYWNANDTIVRASLGGSGAAMAWRINGSVYDTGSLLVDASGIYTLVSGAATDADDKGSAVRLLALDPAHGTPRIFDTGGNRPVLQFDHDPKAVYLAVDSDAPNPDEIRTDRTTSVVRIDKATGERAALTPDKQLTVTDTQHGGYIGLRVDAHAATVFALFEAPPGADGSTVLQVHKIDAVGTSPQSAPSVLYQLTVQNPARTSLRLLGAVDGAALVSRADFNDRYEVQKCTVLILLPGQTAPRIAAIFVHDSPIAGVATDAARIYWLNRSGRIFALPRAALH
jgi:hypothetical protein